MSRAGRPRPRAPSRRESAGVRANVSSSGCLPARIRRRHQRLENMGMRRQVREHLLYPVTDPRDELAPLGRIWILRDRHRHGLTAQIQDQFGRLGRGWWVGSFGVALLTAAVDRAL